ncbi:MAG: ParB/RepB/Spo0J family partition protein [Planctomycetes bacterium]|nr:ParB/RepB/Spo0J family partition protein [Planctomycetota bacterium]
MEFFLSDNRGGDAPTPEGAPSTQPAGQTVSELPLDAITASPYQPRTEFDPQELEQLASSLRSSGVLQPILVRPVDGGFQIIAGERRWRAAQLAGLKTVPALVREIADDSAAVIALVENVQRTDLNAIEKAKAFKRLQALTKASQADVAKQVGLERSTVTNMLRLLELPEDVQQMVSRGTLTMGHARALLALAGAEEQRAFAEEVLRRKWSVREVEAKIQELNDRTQPPGKAATQAPGKAPAGRPVWLNEIEEQLVTALGTAVSVRYGRKRSRITIECLGREEFERVYGLLKGLAGDHD